MSNPIELQGYGTGEPRSLPFSPGQSSYYLYYQSYETGDLGEVDSYSGTGTVEVVEDNFAGSTYALRIDSDGSANAWAQNRFYLWDQPGEDQGFGDVVINPSLYCGFWLKVVDMPATKEWLYSYYAADGTRVGGIQIDSSGYLYAVDSAGTTFGTSASTITEGSTYYVETKWTHLIEGHPLYWGRVQVVVNGQQWILNYGRIVGTTGQKAVLITISSKTKLNTDSWEYRVDDWWMSSRAWGTCRCKISKPASDSDRDYSERYFTGDYADIDEVPPDGVAYRQSQGDADISTCYFHSIYQDWNEIVGLLASTQIFNAKFISRVINPGYAADSTVRCSHEFIVPDGAGGYWIVHWADFFESGALGLNDSYSYFFHQLPYNWPTGEGLGPSLLDTYHGGLITRDHRDTDDQVRCDFQGLIAFYKVYPSGQKDYLPYFDLIEP